MLKLLLFSGVAGLLLGSAIPPAGPLTGSRPTLERLASRSDSLRGMLFASGWEPRDGQQPPHSAPPRLEIDWAGLDPAAHPPCSLQPIVGCIEERQTVTATPASPASIGNPIPTSASAPSGALATATPTGGGSVRVVISIPQQKAYVFQDRDLVWTSKVSTGKPGYDTPLGTFTISQKAVRHRSNLYSNAPMPYMQRLTSGGVALHAGHVPGYRASHGCIRLPWTYAKKLYGMTRSGTKVHVTNQRPRTAEEALSLT